MSWPTIESDPGVFTSLVASMGVSSVQFEELYTLDTATLTRLGKVFGLIFLFKYQHEPDTRQTLDEQNCPDVFFARQMIENACATQAIVNCLLNREDVDIGQELRNYKEFTAGLPSDFKGVALDEVKKVRDAHFGFARPEPILVEKVEKSKGGEAFHFITYVPVKGHLYELDGLKAGPVLLDDCTMENWTEKVVPHIQERILKYSQSEIRFNLMAIIKNRKEHCESLIKDLSTKRGKLQAKLGLLLERKQPMRVVI